MIAPKHVALLIASISLHAMAAAQIIVCPAELPAEAVQITKAPTGWRSATVSPVYLHSAAPTFGPPEKLGVLIGKTVGGRGGEFAVVYTQLNFAPADGLWFSCSYGTGNEFSLARRLDARIKSCVVNYRNGAKEGQNSLDIRCQ